MRAIASTLVLGTCLATSLAAIRADAADFRPVNGFTRVEAARLSPGGHVSVVTGSADWSDGQKVWDWSPVSGPALIGHIPATSQGNWVNRISAENFVVVGKDRYGGSVAFRWTPAGGRQNLGTLPGGGIESVAYDVSADGSVIVGITGKPGGGGYMPIRWTEATGMQALGYLPGFTSDGAAEGVSANGQFILGISATYPSGSHAFRWDASNGITAVGELPGGSVYGRALAASDDGSIVTGTSSSSSLSSEAFRWTAATGIVGLGAMPGAPPGFQNSEGTHVSGDGGTILGKTWQGAFIWTEADGMRRLHDVLLAGGALNLAGWHLDEILDVSHDGTRILGRGNKGLFLADLLADPVVAPPEAVDDGPFTLVEGYSEVIWVGGNDLDFVGPVTVTVVTPPTKGTIAAISAPGPAGEMGITYTANVGAAGADSFVYSMADATPSSDIATVFLDIVPPDTVPEAFSFTDQSDVPTNASVQSDGIWVYGFNVPTTISVAGGEYSVEGGEFTSAAGTINPYSAVAVRHTSASTGFTVTSTVLTIGGVSTTFSSTTGLAPPDADEDGVPDDEDNCTLKANPGQGDSDGDGYGNRCDGDLNNDGKTNLLDLGLFKRAFGTNDADANMDDIGTVNLQDLGLFKQAFGSPPGPSGLVP